MPAPNLLAPPAPSDFVQFRSGFGSRFVVTVDTEEEFDWNAPFDRRQHSLETLPALATFQRFCEDCGVAPIYLIDYPVARSAVSADILGPALRAGRAEVGLQLHPWVTPPFQEDVNDFNSFAGNLPAGLERAKLSALRDLVAARYGISPAIYRAGRYGLGAETAAMLAENGIAIDTSVRSMFDYSESGGPDFRDHPLHPYWIDRERKLLELPLTTVHCGPLRGLARSNAKLSSARMVRGLLARTRLSERIPLTPEGVTAAEAVRGIDVALNDGLPILVFSFHSPSLAPGHTPYVRDQAGVEQLYQWWRTIFDHLATRGVRPTSVSEIMTSVALA